MQCKRFLHTPVSLILSTVYMAIKSEHRTGKIQKDTVKKMGKEVWLKKWEGLTWESGKNWPEKMGRSWLKMRRTDSKNGKAWLENWAGLTLKGWKDWSVEMEVWVEKWEGLTWKSGKDWPKKWEDLTQKMRGTDLEKWEGLTHKYGKV